MQILYNTAPRAFKKKWKYCMNGTHTGPVKHFDSKSDGNAGMLKVAFAHFFKMTIPKIQFRLRLF